MRALVRQTGYRATDLILPVFIREGIDSPLEIASMPGVFQHTMSSLFTAAREAVDAGVGGIMIFGVPQERDATGTAGVRPEAFLTVRYLPCVKTWVIPP